MVSILSSFLFHVHHEMLHQATHRAGEVVGTFMVSICVLVLAQLPPPFLFIQSPAEEQDVPLS